VQISPVDPLDVDLALAERISELDQLSRDDAGVAVPAASGPSRLTFLQHGNDGRPVDGFWVAGPVDKPYGWGMVGMPWRDNLGAANWRAGVHPDHRDHGVGAALLRAAVDLAVARGRTRMFTGAWQGSVACRFLERHGFSVAGQQPYAVRRLDCDDPHRWDALHAEAAAAASDYELLRVAGTTPADLVDGLVTLHEAINDAPMAEGVEPDVWDADRVRRYDESMARRRQTTYRVLARHRATGEWAGMSLLCVDEFAPRVAAQEDTNVVRAHRGHRLGLLMKTEMLRWVTAERPEIVATDTWNSTDNHHMIAVNERLGCRVIAVNVAYRREL
jgi:GNAT superfamily N-acetyltransferase/RimJ/RimL family protein N-acetyltransferase